MIVKISFSIILAVLHRVVRHWSAADEAATRNEKQRNLPVLFCRSITNHKYLIVLVLFWTLFTGCHISQCTLLCVHYWCCRFLVFEFLQVRPGDEKQMSINSPREDWGPSLKTNDNAQSQVDSPTAAIENTPGDQVRTHTLFHGSLRLF